MQITYAQRGNGWRNAGRPREPIPAEIMRALRMTHEQGVQAEVPLYGTSADELRAVVRLLTRGARELGLRLRHQSDGQTLRFYAEDPK